MKGTALVMAGSVAALVVAGCVSDKEEEIMDPGDIPAYVSCSAGAPAPPSTARVIRIRNFAFEPAQVTAASGTTVWWINCDAVVHTSTSDTGVWDSGDLSGSGGTYSRRFDSTGSFPYHCRPHPFMVATVVIQ